MNPNQLPLAGNLKLLFLCNHGKRCESISCLNQLSSLKLRKCEIHSNQEAFARARISNRICLICICLRELRDESLISLSASQMSFFASLISSACILFSSFRFRIRFIRAWAEKLAASAILMRWNRGTQPHISFSGRMLFFHRRSRFLGQIKGGRRHFFPAKVERLKEKEIVGDPLVQNANADGDGETVSHLHAKCTHALSFALVRGWRSRFLREYFSPSFSVGGRNSAKMSSPFSTPSNFNYFFASSFRRSAFACSTKSQSTSLSDPRES